jgi:hypothetical protein
LDFQRVSVVAYHLEGEVNHCWQWIRKTFQEEGQMISWEKFEKKACYSMISL